MKKTVKGYIVMNQNHTLYEEAHHYRVFKNKNYANCTADKIYGEYVKPCTITYTFPRKPEGRN